MDTYTANIQANNIQSEKEISTILSNFSTEYIFGVITDTLQDKNSTFSIIPKPNLVSAYENNFKIMLDSLPSDKQNILYVREETYKEIITLIAQSFNLQLRYIDNEVDLFTLAQYMYDFFIANYNPYMLSFFYQLITKEKEGIYQALKLEENKKSKDGSTLYNKKMYVDPKMALINANLNSVIKYISQIDFSMDVILSYVYANNIIISNLFLNHISPLVNFYRSVYCSVLNNPLLYPQLVTAIRLEIQKSNVILNSNIIPEEI